MELHRHMIQEVVSQHDYRLVAIFIGLGSGESFLSSTWVAARSEVYAMVQCNAHYLPNRAYWLGSPNRLAALPALPTLPALPATHRFLAFDRKHASNPRFWTHRSQRDSPKAALFSSDPYVGVLHAQGPVRRIASKRQSTHKDNVCWRESTYRQRFLAQRPLSTQILCSLLLRYNILGCFVQLQCTSNSRQDKPPWIGIAVSRQEVAVFWSK